MNTINKIEIPVKKVWKDSNDQYKDRPGNIKVKLYADGKFTNKVLALDEKNDWYGEFSDLPLERSGKMIKYTIEEEKIPGYKAEISGNEEEGYIITNTHEKGGSKVNTGDTTNMGLYGLIAVIAIIGIAAIIIIKKRKK